MYAEATTEKTKSDKLVAELQSKEQTANVPNTAQNAITMINSQSFLSQLSRALPKHINPEKLARYAITEIRENPALASCEVFSIATAVMRCAELGLMPGKTLGEAYLIPYNLKDKGFTANLQIGYKGLIRLVFNSGQIKNIYAHCVYSNDIFNYQLGINPTIEHIPASNNPRGDFSHVYCVAVLNHGGVQFEVMSKVEIDHIRSMSKAKDIWTNHYSEMAKKTVLKRLVKYLPISVELQSAVTLDDISEVEAQFKNTNATNQNYALSEVI